MGVRMILSSDDGEGSPSVEEPTSEISDQSSPSPKPCSQSLNNNLRVFTAASGVAAVLATRFGSAFSTPLTSVFMLGVTLTSFLFGARLPKPVVKVVHPLVTCTALTWAVAFAFAKLIGSSFLSVVKSYRTKTLQLFSVGAGDVSYSFQCAFNSARSLDSPTKLHGLDFAFLTWSCSSLSCLPNI